MICLILILSSGKSNRSHSFILQPEESNKVLLGQKSNHKH